MRCQATRTRRVAFTSKRIRVTIFRCTGVAHTLMNGAWSYRCAAYPSSKRRRAAHPSARETGIGIDARRIRLSDDRLFFCFMIVASVTARAHESAAPRGDDRGAPHRSRHRIVAQRGTHAQLPIRPAPRSIRTGTSSDQICSPGPIATDEKETRLSTTREIPRSTETRDWWGQPLPFLTLSPCPVPPCKKSLAANRVLSWQSHFTIRPIHAEIVPKAMSHSIVAASLAARPAGQMVISLNRYYSVIDIYKSYP